MPDLDFIRQGIREEDEPNNDFQYEEGLNNMMNSMTLGDRSMLNISLHGQGNGFNQNPLNYRNEGGDHFGNMMPNVNFLPNVNVNANLNPNVNAKSKFPNPSMNYFKHQNFDEYEDNQHFNISPYIDENPRRGKFDQMGGGFNSAGNFFPNNANNNFGNFYPINNNVNTNFFGNSGNIGNVNNFNLNPQYMNTQRGHINISNNVHTPNMYMNNNPNMYNMNYMNMNMNSNIPMNNFPNNSNGFNSTQNSMNMSNYSANSNYSTAPNEGFFTKKFHNNHHKSGNNSYSKTSIGFNTSLGNEGRKDRGQGNDIPTFEEILDNAISFSKDHSGSRLIQKKFEDGSEQEREKIFSKIQPELLNLCRDVFGNYVIQKILDHSRENVERKSIIVRALSGKFYDLTLHMYGCRVIQKFIEVSEYEDVQLAMRELQNYFSTCIEDQNGNHVMQKLIEKLKQGDHDEIVATAIKRVFSLCVHQYGCRVMQKLLEYCQDSERERILFHIYLRVIDLCQDQFGNYVIQHILDKIGGSKIQPIFDELKGKIFEMSIHKFAR